MNCNDMSVFIVGYRIVLVEAIRPGFGNRSVTLVIRLVDTPAFSETGNGGCLERTQQEWQGLKHLFSNLTG